MFGGVGGGGGWKGGRRGRRGRKGKIEYIFIPAITSCWQMFTVSMGWGGGDPSFTYQQLKVANVLSLVSSNCVSVLKTDTPD